MDISFFYFGPPVYTSTIWNKSLITSVMEAHNADGSRRAVIMILSSIKAVNDET